MLNPLKILLTTKMMMNFDEDEVCVCSLVRLELVQEDGFNRLELIALNEEANKRFLVDLFV